MAKEQQDLIRRISSVVGHELRNPLAVINNSVYFVRTKLGVSGLDPKVKKHLEIIEEEISRADQLIGEVLKFARPCTPEFETKEFDVLVKAIVDLYSKEKNVKIEQKLNVKKSSVKVDEKLFADALTSLLNNAFEATNGKGPVRVETSIDKKSISVSVIDQGPGVNAKLLDTLFEPFITGKSRGMGLGLAMARKNMQAHEGSVEYKTSAQGSTFRLILPKA